MNISDARTLFAGASGRWATQQLKAAVMAGRGLTTKALRTLDTLRHEEWKFFDEALVAEAAIRLVAVGDLISAGLTRPVPNALGKLVFGYEKVTDMDEAIVSLDGLARSDNDVQEFLLNQLPLPITHKDFFINLRKLVASRDSGEALDTTQVRTAGRVVAEALENMLINGGPSFGGLPIYGYTTQPQRLYYKFGNTNQPWNNSGKTGEEMLADVIYALGKLHANRAFGPYVIYVPSATGVRLEDDFKANSDKTIRQRLLEIENIRAVRTADQLATDQVLIVQMTMDTAAWVQGESLQTIQWDEYGGMQINFKAMAIGVPLVRSDAQGRSGVFHFSTSGNDQD
jgi:uncharacterized linocin/CFP29 family protein